jgi:pimeloyl-ACP methyl ester carboxylesterase
MKLDGLSSGTDWTTAPAGGLGLDGNTRLTRRAAARPAVEYDECGSGPALVLVPGSCSTGAAWRPVTAYLKEGFRCITTSLPGYGRTEDRRSAEDVSIVHQCDAVEEVIERAGGPVHLVGHSFGGLVALAVALRARTRLASLTILEATAVGMLYRPGEEEHLAAIGAMRDGYFGAYGKGQQDAIGAMIDFYGGAGTFAAWPERVRAHAIETTPVNMRDWGGAYGFRPAPQALAALALPTLVCVGAASHAAVRRANALVREAVPGSRFAEIGGAAHFMIATHAGEVAAMIADHARSAMEPR